MGFTRVLNVLVFAAALTVFACGAEQAASADTPTVSLFDAQWLGLTPDQPHGWEELNRTVTAEFQQFDFRPSDETQLRFHCNGCAPWTATLTAYAPGEFDATGAREGRTVSVAADHDGYLTENPAEREATLTWEYADNAWATVQGFTSRTAVLDRMVEVARALQPRERSPILLPIGITGVPAHMPLAQLQVSARSGTRLEFAPCGRTVLGGTEPCMTAGDFMSVHVTSDSGVRSRFLEDDAVPMRIGGRDGFYHPGGTYSGEQAIVQLAPSTLVLFEGDLLSDILAGVSFAPDPTNRDGWIPVSDWT